MSVEVTIPSEYDFDVWDVPGFGDQLADPYRQSLVADALNPSAATLLMCFKWERISYNKEVRMQLLESGILGELLGDKNLRRVGNLASVVALDWALKKQLEQDITADELKKQVALKKDHYTEAQEGAVKTMLDTALEGLPKVSPQCFESNVGPRAAWEPLRLETRAGLGETPTRSSSFIPMLIARERAHGYGFPPQTLTTSTANGCTLAELEQGEE